MKALLLTLFYLISLLSIGQNLVLDPGLEDTLKCPKTLGRFYHAINTNERYITHWRSTTRASSDLHNLCGYNSFMPRTGEGYAGIILYDPAGTREYITALFSSPMEAGTCYYVEFYVALKSNCTVGINEVQAHISSSNIVATSNFWPPPAPLLVTPHIQASGPMTQNTYQKISGFYMANGGEDAITFGNFYDNNNTTLSPASQFGSVSSYYFIDDITVTKLDIGPDLIFCKGDSAMVKSNITCPDLTYTWSNGSNDSLTYANVNGPLVLSISGNGSCSAIDTIMVTVSTVQANAGNDVTIYEGESTQLMASGGVNYNWSPASNLSCIPCSDPIASPTVTQTYTVTVTDSNGCTGKDSVTVIIQTITGNPTPSPSPIVPTQQLVLDHGLYIPNSFTPDGDGVNDVFKAKGFGIEIFSLGVFNRWGELIFETNDINEGWDGIYKGKQTGNDLFVYRINVKYNDGTNDTKAGRILVLK